MKTLGLYIHIPFCLRKCHYCDFVSYPNRESDFDSYVATLIKEAQLYNEYIKQRRIDTVFIGGGTPSLLLSAQITRLIDGLKSFSGFYANEFSIEANPESVTQDKIQAYKDSGINRISFGLQTHNNNILDAIGRRHTYEEFLDAYKIASKYIKNFNIDIMFGLPGQSIEDFKDTIKRVVDLEPSHISCYALKLEEGTKLFNEYRGIDDDTDRKMYHLAVKTFDEAGYTHYETSNFAQQGYECRHNLKYWEGDEYLGLGVAASSYNGRKRWTNISDLDSYVQTIDTGNKPIEETATLTEMDKKQEYVMLRFRLSKGICLADYESTFGTNFLEEYKSALTTAEKAGLITVDKTSVKPTLKGFDLQNTLISEFMKII